MANQRSSEPRQAFRFLHLSDLHVGAEGMRQLWPRYKTNFHDDLQKLLTRVGSVDLIIVSGDLANRGIREEYKEFDNIIEEIRAVTASHGAPKIVSVPGNHDVVRPNKINPFAKALTQFGEDRELQRSLWLPDGAEYRSFIGSMFEPYEEWFRDSVQSGIHLEPEKVGILPGDAAYRISTPMGQVGIFALNSTWLQFGASDAKGHLTIGLEQLLAVTNGEPDEWCSQNEISLIVTHQPPDWLSRQSLDVWDAEINPSGRFDVHLFGHMHEPIASGVQISGTARRVTCQAASLFGLERAADNSITRIQGYALGSIGEADPRRRLEIFPRRLQRLASGQYKIVPDTTQDLNEETGSFSVELGGEISNPEYFLPDGYVAEPIGINSGPVANRFDLSQIHFVSIDSASHRSVRRLEQETCVHALSSKRIAWIAAEWGMGLDGFIGSIRSRLSVSASAVYSLGFGDYVDREDFLESIKARYGVSFQQICEALSDAGNTILIFDEIDIAANQSESLEFDIENIARLVADFAPESRVIIRGRRRPRNPTFDVVCLAALDEADVGSYASESEGAGGRFRKHEAVAKLLRHTDGVPARIDTALRELEVGSLSDLLAMNTDFGEAGGREVIVPHSLAASVAALSQSEGRVEQRSYELLLALSALPQGEQLLRLKRFLGAHQFGLAHAQILLDRSLITTVGIAQPDGVEGDGRALVVPKPVRDYVRENLSAEKARSIDIKVLDLYFGSDWSVGDIVNSLIGKRARSPHCDGYEIQNASTLVVRNIRRSFGALSDVDIDGSLRLARAFVACLGEGDHYRAAATICDDIVHLLEEYDGPEDQKTRFRYEYATSLRMSGDVSDAKTALESLDRSHLTKSQKQYASLCLALCYERLGDVEETLREANRALAFDKRSQQGLHARLIIAEQVEDEIARTRQLQVLLVEAVRRKATTIANNIRLELAGSDAAGGISPESLLKDVYNEAVKNSDYYNAARAIVQFASRPGQVEALSGQDKMRLMHAYHYLYNERLFNLFDKCHAVLWRIFESAGDEENLLNLFRRSSFIWRLNGREDMEAYYLNLMKSRFEEIVKRGILQRGKDRLYFMIRITVVTGDVLAERAKGKLSDVS